MKRTNISLLMAITFSGMTFFACNLEKTPSELPVLGMHEYNKKMVDGKEVIDTVLYTIPEFTFIDQDSSLISKETFAGKIYLADFFFTSCPTICPIVKGQMLRVYDKFADNPDIVFISHSIDTRHDSVPVLRDYGKKLQIDPKRWHLVTGDRDEIYGMAKSYFISAAEDPNAAGGYTHSGGVVLVDENFHVRGIYDGTEPEKMDQLMKDLDLLIKSEKSR